jgi:molybdopterin-biosynthesis enzyme MoeA-like protein
MGVPSIMQAMLDEVAPKLNIGVRMLSETVRANMREGDIGVQLGEIANANLAVAIGSYPFFDPQHGANTNVVLRARDAQGNPKRLEGSKRLHSRRSLRAEVEQRRRGLDGFLEAGCQVVSDEIRPPIPGLSPAGVVVS